MEDVVAAIAICFGTLLLGRILTDVPRKKKVGRGTLLQFPTFPGASARRTSARPIRGAGRLIPLPSRDAIPRF